MEIEQLISFTIAAFLMALMPGPDNFLVLTESLHKGKKDGIWLAFGLNSGIIVHTLLAISGVSILIKESEMAFSILQYSGIAYLIYLLIQTLRERPEKLQDKSNEQQNSPLKQFRTGLMMNVLNPKVSLFFLAFLPQFVKESLLFSVNLQLIILGLVFMLVGFATFASIAILAGELQQFIQTERFWKTTKWLKVIVLTIIIVFLIIS